MNVKKVLNAAGRPTINFEERVVVRDDQIRAIAGVLVTRIESANPDASGWYATGSADAFRLFPLGGKEGKPLSKTVILADIGESVRCFGSDVEAAITFGEESLLPRLIEKARAIADELDTAL